MAKAKRNYSLTADKKVKPLRLPTLPYQPPKPKSYHPQIGLIGCGGITGEHLKAYRQDSYEVVAMCDVAREKAVERQKEFYPKASVYTDYREVLRRPDVDVVDVALHPEPRAAVILEALEAGKHVLSQKPFVLDLDIGWKLVKMAERRRLKLAVNQNGRWAPYLAFTREAIKAGLLGEVASVDMAVYWDHTWVKGTPFEKIKHLILYDFGIHWFDAMASFFPNEKARKVFAGLSPFPGQQIVPPLQARAVVEFASGLGTLSFSGHCRHDARETLVVVGTRGVIRTQGGVAHNEEIRIENEQGIATPKLEGKWFYDGFRGTMGELLHAIEEDREPLNSARANLKSLEICFAAIHSANTGKPQVPGRVRRLMKTDY